MAPATEVVLITSHIQSAVSSRGLQSLWSARRPRKDVLGLEFGAESHGLTEILLQKAQKSAFHTSNIYYRTHIGP